MPIEIKELYIKAVVSNTAKPPADPAGQVDVRAIKQEIIKECVQEVLQKLKEKTER